MPANAATTEALDALAALLGPRLNRSQSDRDLHGRSEGHFPPMPPDAEIGRASWRDRV